MTRAQFRWLLGAYLVVVVLNIAVGAFTESLVPKAVRDLETVLPTQSLPALLVLGAFLVGVLGAGLTGLIGMFCFWPPARVVFLVAILLKTLASPAMATWLVTTGWEAIFAEMELLLDGVILTLCLVGPAAHLFRREPAESNQASEVTARKLAEPQR